MGDRLAPNEAAALADLRRRSADGLTYDEIAERIGCSRSRVQQIEATALAKLRDLATRPATKFEQVECALARARAKERI